MAKTVDVRLVNPFVDATVECLGLMAGLKPARKRLFLKQTPVMHGDYAGIIGLSNGVTGSCLVSFPDGLARRVVGTLLNEPLESLSSEIVLDGIGEVANMVGGGAKRKLSTTRYRFDISTPTLISSTGAPVNLFNPPDTVTIALEFSAHPDWPETFLLELATTPMELPA